MRFMPVACCIALLAPLGAQAQTAQEGGATAAASQPSRWAVGVAGAVRSGIYAGEDSYSRAIPFIAYEGERFYLRGPVLGYHLVKRDGFVLDGFVSAQLDAVDADDFGVEELARRGIDRALLEDRDDSADAGLAATWKGDAGELVLEFKSDITDTSGGYAADLSYLYPLYLGGAVITPGIGVTALSSDRADYYYGTLDEEVARGVVEYRPGSVTIPHVGVSVVKPFAQRWRLLARLDYQVLPDEIQDSPLVDEDVEGVGRVFVGVARSW